MRNRGGCRALRLLEARAKCFLSKSKNSLHIFPYKEPVHQRTTTRAVANFIQANGAALPFFECMRVMPELVRPAQLHVHETMGRTPFSNLCAPTDGQPVDANLIVDERAWPHWNRGRGKHVEAQPRRCQELKIVGIGEELEDFSPWSREPHFCAEFVIFHGGCFVRASS